MMYNKTSADRSTGHCAVEMKLVGVYPLGCWNSMLIQESLWKMEDGSILRDINGPYGNQKIYGSMREYLELMQSPSKSKAYWCEEWCTNC